MPKTQIGARTRITIGREMTYGEPWSVDDAGGSGWKEFPIVPGETLKNNISSFTQNTLFADRMVRGISTGSHSPGGSLPFEFMSRGQLTLFEYALGGSTIITQIGATAVKEKAFYGAMDDATFHSTEPGYQVGGLTIRKWFLVENPSSDEDIISPDSFMLEYSGCKVNGFSLSVPTDGFVTGSFDILGLKESVHDYYPGSDGWTAGYWVVDNDIPPASGPYEIKTGHLTEYASPVADRAITSVRLASDASFNGYVMFGEPPVSTAIATVQAININMTNNAERVQVIGNTSAYSIEFGRRQITGDITVVLDNLKYYNYFKNETDLQLKLKFDAKYPDADSEFIEFVLPKVRIGGEGAEAPTPTVTGGGPLSLTLPFQALRSDAVIGSVGSGGLSIPVNTDMYMLVSLDGGLSAVADTQFYL